MQQIDLAPYPTVKRIFETAMALPEFAKAHPLDAAGYAGGDAAEGRLPFPSPLVGEGRRRREAAARRVRGSLR